MLEKESVKLRVASVKTVESFVQKVLRNLSAGQLLQIVCYKVCTTTKTYPDLHAVPNLPTTKGKIKIKGAEHVRKSFMPLNTCRTDRQTQICSLASGHNNVKQVYSTTAFLVRFKFDFPTCTLDSSKSSFRASASLVNTSGY